MDNTYQIKTGDILFYIPESKVVDTNTKKLVLFAQEDKCKSSTIHVKCKSSTIHVIGFEKNKKLQQWDFTATIYEIRPHSLTIK